MVPLCVYCTRRALQTCLAFCPLLICYFSQTKVLQSLFRNSSNTVKSEFIMFHCMRFGNDHQTVECSANMSIFQNSSYRKYDAEVANTSWIYWSNLWNTSINQFSWLTTRGWHSSICIWPVYALLCYLASISHKLSILVQHLGWNKMLLLHTFLCLQSKLPVSWLTKLCIIH